jgi:hypothetical protein
MMPQAQKRSSLVGAQHAEPVHQHADPLLEGVGVEALVAAGGLEPDQAADAFGFVEAFAGTGFPVGQVLVLDARSGTPATGGDKATGASAAWAGAPAGMDPCSGSKTR